MVAPLTAPTLHQMQLPDTLVPEQPVRQISEPPASSDSPEPTLQCESKANILLVDDRADKLLALEAVLSSLGQNVVTARSGKEALRHLLYNDFAVILLD